MSATKSDDQMLSAAKSVLQNLAGRAPLAVNSVSAARSKRPNAQTAVIYAEGNFARPDGKTANGLIRHSEKYDIVAVIDSTKAGLDAGFELDGENNDVPIVESLSSALDRLAERPDSFIFGMAPSSGLLSASERRIVLSAIEHGLHVVNGLHEFLNDDAQFLAASATAGVTLLDIRRPPDKKNLHQFTGDINTVTCPRIAVLGTDCAIGKRTTATILTRALNEAGIKTVMVTTGQTGLIQGARYGVALDAIPSQFCAGELEHAVVQAFRVDQPDVIIIEGQGALSHPAFCTSAFILRGAAPDAVVLQHAPGRTHRCDFPQLPMPGPVSEINLIETFSDAKVIGVTINHEHLSDPALATHIDHYKRQLKLPVTDALTRPIDELVQMVLRAFPQLNSREATLME